MVLDVVVIGASVAGLTAARRLAAEGFSVTVLDPNQEYTTAAIGHGVAACAHAATVANMAGAYGGEAAREHVRRNLAGLETIRDVAAAGALELTEVELHDHSLGVALDRELQRLRQLIGDGGAEVELLTPRSSARAAAGLCSPALLVDPVDYAITLEGQAASAGAKILHDITVTRIKRLDGVTQVAFRRNLAWSRDLEVLAAHAVVDTLAVSPWGSVAGVGQPQYVPTLRLRGIDAPEEVTLLAGPPTWLIRPVDDGALLLGPKCARSQVVEAAAALANWARAELGASDATPGQLVIDPSDHGRPVAGASAIPGGFYARGNGRGELMNGTASGCYLAALLLGTDVARAVSLPWASKLRAGMGRLLRRRPAG
jgi:FAD dependent oxidoreductase